jgi:hypothetical protein
LEVLTLTLDNRPDPDLIAAIVGRLDPARVRELQFRRCGSEPLPECLKRAFGDRAVQETECSGGNDWRVSAVTPPQTGLIRPESKDPVERPWTG